MQKNADDFMTKLLAVKESWNAKEQQNIPTGTNAAFYDYIAERVSIFTLVLKFALHIYVCVCCFRFKSK